MAKILKMVVQRLALGLLTLFVVSLIISLGVEPLPGQLGDPLHGKFGLVGPLVRAVGGDRVESVGLDRVKATLSGRDDRERDLRRHVFEVHA